MIEQADQPPDPALTRYRIGLDRASAERLVTWLSSTDDPPDVELIPSNLEDGDVVALGEQSGLDRDDAVRRLLNVGGLGASEAIARRIGAASTAAHDGVPLRPEATAVTNVGAVPVELDRRLKIG